MLQQSAVFFYKNSQQLGFGSRGHRHDEDIPGQSNVRSVPYATGGARIVKRTRRRGRYVPAALAALRSPRRWGQWGGGIGDGVGPAAGRRPPVACGRPSPREICVLATCPSRRPVRWAMICFVSLSLSFLPVADRLLVQPCPSSVHKKKIQL